MFYADTEHAAWKILHEIQVSEFVYVKHKVSPALKTNKPSRFIARLFILEPLHQQLIDALDYEFTATYASRQRYIRYYPLTYAIMANPDFIYVLMLCDEERAEVMQLVERYEYSDTDGFVPW